MISKTKEVFKKLEFGVLELFVGALMIIGLAGYFASVPADLDWIDHTASFILFSYLFYKLNVTSILFGKTSKLANALIIASYFSLFFKDVISYTTLDVFKFKVIKFVDYFYLFFSGNFALTNLISIYIGIIGLFLISIYLTKNVGMSHPSLLYAICQREIKKPLIKFLSIFVLLLAFYYFVYSIILEWLEFTLDDPVVAAGIVFYIYTISKNYRRFHANDFIFKIGDFSIKWYSRFISLFHYKKTLPLAISGLLVLHALSDLGVFAYSLTFSKENFYLEFIGKEHRPFLDLFLDDIEKIPGNIILALFFDYFLNALSLIILLLIPIVVWARMFSRKEMHLNRVLLFFIFSSITAHILLPGYVIRPLSEKTARGVDITSVSLLESRSVLDGFFADKTAVIVAVAAISIIFGLLAYILSSNFRIKKELYAASILFGLTFFAVYLFYFFSSLLAYFYGNILNTLFTPHFLIGAVFSIFLILAAIFYAFGYLFFVYEIIMEYHKRKWSEPIDEDLVKAIRKIKSTEKRAIKRRKLKFS